jgi:hypothetical protein
MQKNIVGRWGFIIGGILFLIAALVPLATGSPFEAKFFIIGIALLVIGAAIARKGRNETSNK